jgi:small GTP-binding protein
MEEVKIKQKITLAFYGDGNVGKTSIIQVYDNGIFSIEQLQTVGSNSIRKTIYINDNKTIVTIYDTAGQAQFKNINVNLLNKAEGVILVYAVNDLKSFQSVKETRDNLIKAHSKIMFMVLVGNKNDLDPSEREVTTQQGKDLAKELGIPFFETSAKLGTNLENMFKRIISDIYKNKFNESVKKWTYDKPTESKIITDEDNKKEPFVLEPIEVKKDSFCKKICGCLFK